MDRAYDTEDYIERPAKKARLLAPPSPARSVTSDAAFDDTDDLYESPLKASIPQAPNGQIEQSTSFHPLHSAPHIMSGSIPGLGLLEATIQQSGHNYHATEFMKDQGNNPHENDGSGRTDFEPGKAIILPAEAAPKEATLTPRLSTTPSGDLQIEVVSVDLIGHGDATTNSSATENDNSSATQNDNPSESSGLEDGNYSGNLGSQIADLSTENLDSTNIEISLQAASKGRDDEHEMSALNNSFEEDFRNTTSSNNSRTEGLLLVLKANGSSVPGSDKDGILDSVVHTKSLEFIDTTEPSNRTSPSGSPKSNTSAGGVELQAATVKAAGDVEYSVARRPIQTSEPAEWQNDSTDMDSSSSSSDSNSSSSVGGDDEDYEFLDAEEQARILMRGDGGDDDDGANQNGKGSGGQLRTANERPEEKVERPNVVVTPEMQILELGIAENVVENYLLIKATISGETQVLESGSVLCLEDRTVIGAVAETLGRVESPLYSVAFSSAAEVEQYGVTKGTRIYYVVEHAYYVFTQPLKMLKGSDASNQHDEEVGHEELEFSDDEAEAEYKRKLKQGRLEKKTIKMETDQEATGFAPSTGLPPPDVQQYPTGPMNYDDDQGDDMYTPLARPSNLLDMSQSTINPPQIRNSRGSFDRVYGGRGQGERGRGRGERVRGRGDRGRGQPNRDRGGQKGNNGEGSNHRSENRGRGYHGNRGDRSGNSVQSSQISTNPLNYPTVTDQQTQHPSDHEAFLPLQALPGQTEGTYQHGLQNTSAPYQPTTHHWGHDAVAAYDPNYPQGLPSNQMPMSPGGTIPAGAFVNPAFFRNQNQPNSPAPMYYQQQPYSHQPYTHQPYAQQAYSQQPYAQQPYSQQPYSQQSYQQPYQQQAYQQEQYQQGMTQQFQQQFQQQYQYNPHQPLQPANQWNQHPYQTNAGSQFGDSGSF